MAFCAGCGSALDRDARFCGSCGAEVSVRKAGGSPPAVRTDRPVPRETRRMVTILFADVVGSTTMGETLDPEAARRHVHAWFGAARTTIERHGGTVEKFIGDAVMAVFGVPVVHEDDAFRALSAAAELRDDHAGPLKIRIGLDTGVVVAGDATSGASFVTGDAVNTAARLQAAAEPGEVLLGDTTWRLTRTSASSEPVEPLVLKGKSRPVSARRLGAVQREAPAIARRLGGPMVGRSAELARLRGVLDDARQTSTARVVTVVGQPGIGKSRLVHEFLKDVRPDAAVMRGHCLPYGEGITYAPIVELVRDAAGAGPDDEPEAVAALITTLIKGIDNDRLVADQLTALAGPPEGTGAPHEVAWAVRRMLERMAERRPVVAVIDDLQWAEPSLIDLVEHIAEWARTSPILLLCMARPELYEDHPDWMRDREAATSIRLEPLTPAEGSHLVNDLLGGLPLAADARERIAVAADGNPLFIEQLLAMLVDDGELSHENDQWVSRGELDRIPIPPSITALLAARLDRLGQAELATLERAAVVGKTFSWGAVAELAPENERAAAGRHLAALLRRELVVADPAGLRGDEAFRFRHLLILDAAYDGISKAERARLHERFATWLEGGAGEETSDGDLVRAYHLEQAARYRAELGDDGGHAEMLAARAVRLLAPAGRAALERGDVRAASALLRRATDLCPPGRERIELGFDLSSALVRGGENAASDEAESEAVAMLSLHPDEGLDLRRRMNEAWKATERGGSGTFDDVIGISDEAYAWYERHGDQLGMMGALRSAGEAQTFRGELSREAELLGRAIDIARESGHPGRAERYAALLANRLPMGPMAVPAALTRCREYLEVAGDNRGARAIILLSVGELEAMDARTPDWRRHFDDARSILDDLGLLPVAAADHPMILAMAELQGGEPGRVEGLLRWSCETLERLGDEGHLATVAPLLAEVLLSMGKLDGVEDVILRGRDVSFEDDLDAQVRWRLTLGLLRSAENRHDEAVRLAHEAVDHVAATEYIVLHADTHLALAKVLQAAGDPDGSRTAALEARRLAKLKQNRAAIARIETFLAAG